MPTPHIPDVPDSSFPGTAQEIYGTPDAARTITFPSVTHKRHAEALLGLVDPIPGNSEARDAEHSYQIDTARTVSAAARRAREATARITQIAQVIAAGSLGGRAFPTARMVQEAMREMETLASVASRLMDAMDSAMLADVEGAKKAAAQRQG